MGLDTVMGITAESVGAVGIDGEHPGAVLQRKLPGADEIGIDAVRLQRFHVGRGARPHGVLRQIARVITDARSGGLAPAITT